MGKVHVIKAQNGKTLIVDGEGPNLYKIDTSLDSENSINEVLKGIGNRSTCVEPSMNKQLYEENLCTKLVLNVTSSCNLQCKYCYAHEGKYALESKTTFMTVETALCAVKEVSKLYSKGIKSIQFFGGEPLLKADVIRDIIIEINQFCEQENLERPEYTIVTNGTLITDDVIDMFDEYFASVTVSLDGNKDITDHNRIYKGSCCGIYSKVSDNIKNLLKPDRKYLLGIEGTITASHIRKFDKEGITGVDEILAMNADYYHFAPAVLPDHDPEAIQQFEITSITSYFEKFTEELLQQNKLYRNSSLQGLRSIFKNKKYGSHICGAGMSELAVDVDGNIYPCFMFIGEKDFKYTNATDDDIFNEFKSQQKKFRELLRLADMSEECTTCWAKKLCSHSYSRCLGARYMAQGTINQPVKLGCEISKKVIETIIRVLIGEESI